MTVFGDARLPQRFWDKVSPEPNSGCWMWVSKIDRYGYGQFWNARAKHGAHRIAYEHLIGPIPTGLTIDHLCRTRCCVNPEHLEPTTIGVNVRRGGNSIKTHCKEGHPFNEENTYRYPNGDRACRTCTAERSRAKAKGTHNRTKTHCKKGHPYDDVNTYRYSGGNRGCKTCRAEWRRVSRAKARA